MTAVGTGLPVVADVMSFDPAGFVDHDAEGFTRWPAAVLRVHEPVEVRGTTLTLVLDGDVAGADLLAVPGTRVRLLLDPDTRGSDAVFAGALVDGAVHPVPGEGP